VRYLEQSWRFLRATFLLLDWAPRSVSPNERISRFIPDERWMNKIKGLVYSAAFMPSKKTRDISVYRTSGCSERRIWLIGLFFVERKRRDKKRILGRADVKSNLVFREGLKLRARLLPHPRHAELTDWPDDKAHQKDKVLALAQGATLGLRPDPWIMPRRPTMPGSAPPVPPWPFP
jgi:hypothetical protein